MRQYRKDLQGKSLIQNAFFFSFSFPPFNFRACLNLDSGDCTDRRIKVCIEWKSIYGHENSWLLIDTVPHSFFFFLFFSLVSRIHRCRPFFYYTPTTNQLVTTRGSGYQCECSADVLRCVRVVGADSVDARSVHSEFFGGDLFIPDRDIFRGFIGEVR